MSRPGDNTREVVEFILKTINAKGTVRDSELKLLLQQKFSLSDEKRFEAVELIHRSQVIALKPLHDGDLAYSLLAQARAVKNFATGEENQLYQEILRAGAAGLSKLELKGRTKLGVKVVARVLKNLEKEGHVVQHKTKDRNRVVFMEASVVPEENVVGGNLYAEGQVDQALLDALHAALLRFVRARGSVSYAEMLSFLAASEEGRGLDEKEAQLVVNCLILDKALRKEGARFSPAPPAGLFRPVERQLPCFGCPVFDACRPGAYISPATCVYFNEW